jgi:hypothetical protein
MDKKIEIITKEKIKKYRDLSQKALDIAKKSITKGKEIEAREITMMVECYLEDSIHFESKLDYVNSFACLNYAHGWIDAGARLKIFDVTDNNLFTV